MKLLTKETYERNLKELMNTPIGGLPPKTIERQESIVINDQPAETPTTPTPVGSQQQTHAVKERQISLTRLGLLIGIGGTVGGYIYATSPTIQLQIKTIFTKLVPYLDNPIIMGSIVLGVVICSIGLVKK